ncbi:class I SAM-dependent methyltransferase [Cedecea sp. FDAARGOS_727]|uniref:class I SAM-dependent methyltransferase n=1 Tax=Cedecea sp. FDAARGOS_727 TaxID=2545798 RepID=UPI00143E629A|nr:class I SAM-dependent methyltransferase [Cedecea sp. FDAARGOS_727]QIX97331.1 class I SAM-dependent methyltransferase [Cedecea sp. FDAARGOS_727]
MSQTTEPAKLITAEDWDQKWQGIFDHYQNDIRHAYYIDAVRKSHEKRVLEIAAGSFRDIVQLTKRGVEGHGIDFSPESVSLAKKLYPSLQDRFSVMNAFNLQYPDKHFDLTYHNGFWGYFAEEEIHQMATEQARITKGRMIVTVHNAHNKSFVNYFNSKKAGDAVFDIKFFTIEQMQEILGRISSRVIIIPVGKGKKTHEDWLIRHGLHNPLLINGMFKWSGDRYLERSERLMCIAEM